MPSYGQFGTPGYAQSTIPTPIVQQYPGAKNYQDALRGFDILGFGPLAGGFGRLAASGVTDPVAGGFQTTVGPGGAGAFAQPGAASAQLGGLFGSQMESIPAAQGANQQFQNQVLGGIANVGKGLGASIDQQQQAAIQLEAAKNAQQAQTAQGIMGLVNLLSDPQGMGANIMQAFGADPGTTPLGAGVGGLGSLFSGLGTEAGAIFGQAGGGPSISAIGSWLASFLPSLGAAAAAP